MSRMNQILYGTSGRPRATLEERFWARVPNREPGECWEWDQGASRDRFGYGLIWRDGRYLRAHRVSWEIHHGREIPEGMVICHTCDNPPCVNPAHLFVGTRADNMADMDAKGRRRAVPQPGESNGGAKLTEREVLEIRDAASRGEGLASLMERYRVSKPTLSKIISRKSWRHV